MLVTWGDNWVTDGVRTHGSLDHNQIAKSL